MGGVWGAERVAGQVKSPAEKIKESRLKVPKSTSRSRAAGAPPPTAQSKAAKTKRKGSKPGSKPPQAPGNQSRGAAAEAMGGTGIIPGESLPSTTTRLLSQWAVRVHQRGCSDQAGHNDEV